MSFIYSKAISISIDMGSTMFILIIIIINKFIFHYSIQRKKKTKAKKSYLVTCHKDVGKADLIIFSISIVIPL